MIDLINACATLTPPISCKLGVIILISVALPNDKLTCEKLNFCESLRCLRGFLSFKSSCDCTSDLFHCIDFFFHAGFQFLSKVAYNLVTKEISSFFHPLVDSLLLKKKEIAL